MAADLQFRIGAELSGIKTALAGLRAEFAAVGKAASGAGNAKAFGGIESGAAGALRQVKALITGFVTLAGVASLARIADETATLNARLRAVTKSQDEFNRAQVQTFEIAQRNGTAIGTVADLYVRLANATKEAGTSQEVLLELTETITRATQLAGGSVQSAQAAIEQLGQALSSGTLNGDELRSIREQAPALAQAIADGLGVSVGALRKLGEQGELTTAKVIGALQKAGPEIAKQAAQIPLTLGRSVQQTRNAFAVIVSTFDETAGATGGLATSLSDLAQYISSPEAIGAIVQLAAAWGNGFRQITQDFGAAIDIIKENTGDLVGTGENAVDLLVRAFRELPVNVRASVRMVVVGALAAFDSVVAGARFLKESLVAVFTDGTIEAAAARYARRLDAIRQAAQATIDDTLKDRDAALGAAAAARAEAERRRKAGARPASGDRSAGTFTQAAGDAAKREGEALAKATSDVAEKLLKDSSKRSLAILENLYEDAKLPVVSYFEQRRMLELKSLDGSIAIEQARLATAKPADRAKILGDIELLEREKTDIELKAVRDRDAAVRDIEKQLRQVEVRDLENRGQTAEATRVRLQGEFQDPIARLQTEGKTAEVKRIQDLIELEANRAKFEQLKAEAEQVIAALEARQQSIVNQRTTGAITPAVAEDQSRQARDEAIPKLDGIAAELGQLRDIAADPKITEGVDRFNGSLETLKTHAEGGLKGAMNDLRASLANLQEGFAGAAVNAGVDAMNGLFTDLLSGSKSAGDALKGFARSFAASMAQIAAKAVATFAVLKLLEALGVPVALVTGSVKVGASVKHAGGIVGSGGVMRQVNPLVFASAPRFHGGGMVGLKPDERPAILQTGERVLNRQQTADYNGGGSGSGAGTRVINVIDPNLVQDYMTSSGGERTILNVIERNAGAIRQKLA